jgi:hypothetical protein
MWNGTTWSSLGLGLNDTVYALASDGDRRVFAAGNFTTADGASASRIAFWNGSSWTPLGAGVDNTAYALSLTENGNLAIGGDFTTAGFVTANHIALWNGTSWGALGTGTNDTVYAIATGGGGLLFVGGDFTAAGGISASHIAEWNGSSWTPLGSGVDASVFALALNNDHELFAGGAFSTAGGNPASFIAQWDGSQWNPVGEGLNSIVFSLSLAPDGTLAAAGVFTQAGSTPVNRIATWNGTTWSPTGRGIDSAVSVVAHSPSGTLYAGGVYGLGYIKLVGVNDQRAGSVASVLEMNGQTFITYVTTEGDVKMRNITGAPHLWGEAIPVHLGDVASQATGYLPLTQTISTWFIENGTVYHQEANAPYHDWSVPQVVSSDGSPRSISTEVSASYSPNKIVATWNRGGATRGEVVAAHHIEVPPTSVPDPRCERLELQQSLQRVEVALLSVRNRANLFAAKEKACGGKSTLHDRTRIIFLGKTIRSLTTQAWGGTLYACPVYACERRSVRSDRNAINKYVREYGIVARSIAQRSAESCKPITSRSSRPRRRDSIDFTNRLLRSIQQLPSEYSVCS